MKTYMPMTENRDGIHYPRMHEIEGGYWVPADTGRALYESLSEMQSWITDGGHEDDPDIAYMCGKARAALAAADGEAP